VVEIGKGERITDEAELGVTLLADVEQIGVVEIRTAPGGTGPPFHAHARHAECFFVLEGALRFRLENRELDAGHGTWVLVPPEVVHTFAAIGSEPAHFLGIHAPNSGFGDFVRAFHAARGESEIRAARAAFDQHPPPEYASADPALVVTSRAGGSDGETLTDRPGRRATVLVDAHELIVSEFHYGPGERGAQPHVHHHHADAFLVVEGEFTFASRDGSFSAPAGTFLLFPPGVVHGFDNDSEASARCFNLHLPASGFGDYMRGRNPDFDQYDPPEDGGVDPASVVAVRLSGGAAV
jgi:quercetin dioxygenase-like cupin family protein